MLFGIISMIIVGLEWTIDGVVIGRAPRRKISINSLMFWGALSMGICCLFFCLLTGGLRSVSLETLIILSAILMLQGCVNFLQIDWMSRSMQNGPNGVIWSVTQSGFIFPLFMGILFFGESKTLLNYLGLAAILISLFMFGSSKSNSSRGPWRRWMLLSFLATGGSQCLSNVPSYFESLAAVPSSWKVGIAAIGMSSTGLLLAYRRGGRQALRQVLHDATVFHLWKYCACMYFPFTTASALFLYPGMDSLARANAGALAFPLMVCSCIIGFQVIAICFMREKCSIQQWMALILCLTGISVLCI